MSQKAKSVLRTIILILIFAAILDTVYLTYKHYSNAIPTCSTGIFSDCGAVLKSEYSVVWGVPLSLLGLAHYLAIAFVSWSAFVKGSRFYKRILFIQTAIGLLFSAYLTYIQVFVIGSLCQYCLLSALISLSLYVLVRYQFKDTYREFVIAKTEFCYKFFLRR